MDKKPTTSVFWAKHLALAVIVVIVAAVVIHLQMNLSSQPKPVDAPDERSVARGLSDFYSEFRMTNEEPVFEGADMVLDMAMSDESLEERLESMSSEAKPVDDRWVGEYKYRTFTAGNTLRKAISAYAEQEGMQVIWNLKQDFVIKHQFQMDDTVAGSLATIASAIDSNFEGKVATFVCPKQRSLVVTEEMSEYLTTECNRVRTN
ncbi:MAG: TcpQ domain-containing protein [Alteromonadaceae bacterium]|nr:TcpQ domain-containing protein [Alteromonadaceae bacterium]